MFDYTKLIVDTMKNIDEKIESVSSDSIDKSRLRNKVNIHIVSNIKNIALLKKVKLIK